MKINILNEEKKRMEFEIEGESHTLCNMLKNELLNDENVKIAIYRINHPLLKTPRFLVETNGNETPREALVKAAKRILKTNEKFAEVFSSAFKK
ncbi:MAG: DNA-directed RNA polymerase subunit L [Candidatus Woesearchaeota archaeon]